MQEVDSKQGKMSLQLSVNSIQFDHGMFRVSVSTQAIYMKKWKHIIYALSKKLLWRKYYPVTYLLR